MEPYKPATIQTCYNTGTITATGNNSLYVGGVAGGQNGGQISLTCNTDTVAGTKCVGGVVGLLYSDVAKSYNTANVTGTINIIGGVVVAHCRQIVTMIKKK